MNPYLKQKNIVLAGVFNPPTFEKYFFIKHEIFTDSEILSESQFHSNLVQVLTLKYNILVLSNQIIITVLEGVSDDEIKSFLKKFLSKNVIADINLMGFNFEYVIEFENVAKTNLFSKQTFFNSNSNIYTKSFNSEDAAFGAYMSKNFKCSRLKLDIKPAKAQEIGKDQMSKDVVLFAFNLNFELKNLVKSIDIFQLIEEYKDECIDIMSIYNK
jgi:hypothetical protein